MTSLEELEVATAANWLERGTIEETHCGEENTYYVDEFGYQYFCKNVA